MVDLHNSDGLRGDILDTLRKHGVDTRTGQAVEIDNPALLKDIYRAIGQSEHAAIPGEAQKRRILDA